MKEKCCVFGVRFSEEGEPQLDSLLTIDKKDIKDGVLRSKLKSSWPGRLKSYLTSLKGLELRARFNCMSVYCVYVPEDFANRENFEKLLRAIPPREYKRKFLKLF